ncbi:MAG: hypothetical protein LBQ27_02785 [Clostridiales bacterium]|jgi:hypothetical protein|nr:hypothetical protein [Clostridiales bacterium]
MDSKTFNSKELEIKKRDAVIDNAKGILVLLYAFLHVMRNLRPGEGALPDLFFHSGNGINVYLPWWGFNLLDLAPIAFYFFIGFVIYPVFIGHYAKSGKSAYKRQFLKNLSILGLFLFAMYLQNAVTGANYTWLYCAGIGFTGILLMPFLTSVFRNRGILSTALKFAAAVFMLILYSFIKEPLSGMFGAVSWYGGGAITSFGFVAVILLTATVKDISKKGIIPYVAATAVIYILGVILTKVVGLEIDYQNFSVGYLIAAFSKMNLIFFVLYAINKYALKDKAIPLLATIGRNLLLYLTLTFLIIAGLAPFSKRLIENPIDMLYAVLITIGVLCAYIGLSAILEKKRIIVKL